MAGLSLPGMHLRLLGKPIAPDDRPASQASCNSGIQWRALDSFASEDAKFLASALKIDLNAAIAVETMCELPWMAHGTMAS